MDQITFPLGIESLKVISQSLDNKGSITLTVISKKKYSTCHKCGKHATIPNGKAPERTIRHLSILDKPVYLKIVPLRYLCEHCNPRATSTEHYDWCARKSSVTYDLENYLMKALINSNAEDVSQKYDLGISVVQTVLKRQIDVKVDWTIFKNLEVIGIDEISIKKGHQSYLTIVSTKPKGVKLRVIAVLEGRSKDKLKEFLESIPLELKKTVRSVCTDMYDGFVNPSIEVFGTQALVIDRYHVTKLYRKPLDQLRIEEMKRLKIDLNAEEYTKLEGMMWILRKKYECLTETNKESLALLYKYSPSLKKAHSYALKLTSIFNTKTHRKSAIAKIDRWILKVKKSDVRCFDRFVATLSKYKPLIANYFKERRNSGFVEGLNNKIKVLKRRCYGLFKTESIFRRLYLDLQGYEIYVG